MCNLSDHLDEAPHERDFCNAFIEFSVTLEVSAALHIFGRPVMVVVVSWMYIPTPKRYRL